MGTVYVLCLVMRKKRITFRKTRENYFWVRCPLNGKGERKENFLCRNRRPASKYGGKRGGKRRGDSGKTFHKRRIGKKIRKQKSNQQNRQEKGSIRDGH